MFQFKKEIKEQVSQTEEKLNLHPVIHVSESLLDYQKKLSQTDKNKTAFHSIIAEHGLFVKGEILMCVEAARE